MVVRRRKKNAPQVTNFPAIVHLWILRILVPLGCYRNFINPNGFSNDTLAELLHLGECAADRQAVACFKEGLSLGYLRSNTLGRP